MSIWTLSSRQIACGIGLLLTIWTTVYVSYNKYYDRSAVYSNLFSDRNLGNRIGMKYRTRAVDLQDTCIDIDPHDGYSFTSLVSTRIYLDTHYESTSSSVRIFINAFDQKHRSKSIGHDVIVVWAQQTDGDGRVSGNVIDNANGSYSATLKTFWTGSTLIYATLLSPI